MAKRKDGVFAQINAIGGGSYLPPEYAEKMKAAGIGYSDQNAWFHDREFEGKRVGAEIRTENGITVFYCSDFTAEYLNSKFREQLIRAFGNRWKIVGTSSDRRKTLENPVYSLAKKSEISSDAETVATLRNCLAKHKQWIADNTKSIIHWDYVNQATQTLQNLIAWKSRDMREAA